MALVERCRASSVSHRWKDCMCAAFPSSCSLKFEYKATRDGAQLPRSWFHFAKFINWKVVEQTTTTWSSTSRITSASRPHWGVFCLGFLKSKHNLNPPIIISLLFKRKFMQMKPMLFGFQSFSRLVQKMNDVFEQLKLSNSLSSNSVYTGTPIDLHESSACGNDHTTTALVKAPNDGASSACSVKWKRQELVLFLRLQIILCCLLWSG